MGKILFRSPFVMSDTLLYHTLSITFIFLYTIFITYKDYFGSLKMDTDYTTLSRFMNVRKLYLFYTIPLILFISLHLTMIFIKGEEHTEYTDGNDLTDLLKSAKGIAYYAFSVSIVCYIIASIFNSIFQHRQRCQTNAFIFMCCSMTMILGILISTNPTLFV